MKLFRLTDTAFANFDNAVNNYFNKIFASLGIQFSDNQIFKVIFTGLNGIMQNIMLYIEDAFTEQNIETAVRKKSIYSLAKLSGYEPYYGSAATGILIASIISNNNKSNDVRKIYIPNHAVILDADSGQNYILYLQSDRYVFDVTKPLTNYEFRIIQGTFNIMSTTTKGFALETIHLNIKGMFDKNYIKVLVNNVEWQAVSNLYDMTENGEEYILSIGFENEVDITFGNDIYGKIPTVGSTVTIEYIVHNGSAGNVNNIANSNFGFITSGSDFYGNDINLNNYIKLSLDNYISGGTNSETIADVKKMIGYNSRSNVLASIDNYRLFLKRFSFIGNFNIWAENNSNILCINAINNTLNNINNISDYETIREKDLLLTELQKQNVLTVLKNSNNTFAGISIKFVDPIIYKYAIICYVKVDDKFYRDLVENDIQESVLEYFSSKQFNITFISKSDIINYILNNCDHIKSLDIEIVSNMNEEAFKNKYYYKYETVINNNQVYYNLKKYNYETDLNLGLDDLGNIKVESNLYLPLLSGDVTYFSDKTSEINNIETKLNAVNIIFL